MINYKSNKKILVLILSFFLLIFLSVGYAVLNTTLSINGVADISKNTWDIHFENIVVSEESIEATTPATIDSNNTEINFTVPLNIPGDKYTFEVDIVNNGTIDAKLDSLVKTALTTEQEKYLIFDVKYLNGLEIATNDALKAGTKETILVNVEYDRNIENEDLVTTDTSVSFSLQMNYVQDDGRSIAVVPTLYRAVKKDAVLDNIKSTYVTASTGIDFSQISSDTNGKGVYTIATTMNEEYPISYYRGDVDNNNVLFGGFCWLIVRTTEKGGVKLIYNGEPDSIGMCPGSESGDTILLSNKIENYSLTPMAIEGIPSEGAISFNENNNSLADVGYMYGMRYESLQLKMIVDAEDDTSMPSDLNIVYGNDVVYDTTTGLYTLVTTATSKVSEWRSNYEKILGANGYHYTCFSEDNTCSEVFYVYQHVDSGYSGNFDDGEHGILFYITLQSGKKIENAIDEMFENNNNSTIKTKIDTWYSENMTNYTEYLEDTIWCNDRSIYDYAGWNKDGDASSKKKTLTFAPENRAILTYKPSLSCSNKRDSFTVDESETGNGKLTYPVGMITSDEVMYAGGTKEAEFNNYYLNNEFNYWTLSTGDFWHTTASNMRMYSDGSFNSFEVGFEIGVRPSISLKNNTIYLNGDGTKENPYQVGETTESEA